MPFTRRSRPEPGSKPTTPNTKADANGSSPSAVPRKFLRSASNLSPLAKQTPRKIGRPRKVRATADGTKITFRNLPQDFISNLLADSQLKNSIASPEEKADIETEVKKSPTKSSPVSAKSEEQLLPIDPERPTSEDSVEDSESEVSPDPKPTSRSSRGGRGRGRGGRGGRPRGRGRGGRQSQNAPPLEPPTRKRTFRDAAPKNLAESSDEDESAPATPAAEVSAPGDDVSIEKTDDTVDKVELPKVPETTHTDLDPQDDAKYDAKVNENEPAQSIEVPAPKRPKTITRENSGVFVSRQPVTPSEVSESVEETLMDIDLPPPFIGDYQIPKREDCEDQADFFMKSRYQQMTDPQIFINSLTKFDPSKRSTEVLYALAENAQYALKAWQDEYLALDALTAPAANPPKKPATGGRLPYEHAIWEDMKEADLYNYAYDPKKPPGTQDPIAQRIGRDSNGGRELRQRRVARDALGSAQVSEDDDDNENGVGKRKRRAAQRFEGTATPEFGARGSRKRLHGLDGETDVDDKGVKRPRTAAALLPQRIREMRGESIAPSMTEGEDGSPEPPGSKRRGRPPGSKNLQQRSDAGVKKGPRKPNVPVEGESVELTPGVRFVADEHQAASPAVEAANRPQPDFNVIPGKVQIAPQTFDADGNPTRRKQRAKSEKRSASMTAWWAERKARAAQQKEEELKQMRRHNPGLPPPMIHHDPRHHPSQMVQALPPAPHAHYPGSSVHHAPVLAPAGPPSAAAYPLTGGPPPSFSQQNPPHHPQHPYPHAIHPQQQPPPLPPRSAHGPPSGHHDPYFVRAGPVAGQYTLNPNKMTGPPAGVPSPYPMSSQGQFRPGSRDQ